MKLKPFLHILAGVLLGALLVTAVLAVRTAPVLRTVAARHALSSLACSQSCTPSTLSAAR